MIFEKEKVLRFLPLLLSLGLASCSPGEPRVWSETPPEGVQVIATFSILADLIDEVGKDRVAVRVLVPREGDPHTFDAAPAHSRNLVDADLIFEIGQEFEPWLDRLVQASGTRAKRTALTSGLRLLHFPSNNGHEHHHQHHDHEHAHGAWDPHVWHDVRRVQEIVKAIRDALSEKDPAGKEEYADNAAAYLEKLEQLDAWILLRIEEIPRERRLLVTGHNVFGYFLDRYAFVSIGTVLDALTSEVADPSASQMGNLVQKIRASGVTVLFPEAGFNPTVLEQIAREARVKVAPPLYTDSLSREGGVADTYIRMMRHNVETLVKHLDGQSTD